jgi:hypothetical protein
LVEVALVDGMAQTVIQITMLPMLVEVVEVAGVIVQRVQQHHLGLVDKEMVEVLVLQITVVMTILVAVAAQVEQVPT